MVSVFECADFFIKNSQNSFYPAITPLKLQKLLYYAQVYSLIRYQNKLFDNDFEAWVHGPVCPIIYKKYQHIKKNEAIPFIENCSNYSTLGVRDIDILYTILNTYGKLSGDQLEYLTHKEEPWMKARKGLKPWESGNNIISTESILRYYKLA